MAARGGSIVGYLTGALAGLVIVAVVLIALALVAPVEELPEGEGVAELEVGEPAIAGPEAAEGGESRAVDGLAVAGEEPADEPVMESEATETAETEGTADSATAPGTEVGGLQPVEMPGLSGELPADSGEAAGDGAADAIPPELETVLEGAEENSETVGTADAVAGERESEGEETELAAAGPSLPPPLDETRPISLAGPALSVNAASYAAAEGQPLVGVMFDAAGGAGELPPDVLFALPVPATLGIVPGSEGDEALAAAARARNWEVVAQLPVAEGADDARPGALAPEMTPEEIAERTEALMGRLSQAVGAAAGGELADAPAALDAVRAALAEHGFAWVGEGSGDAPATRPTLRVPPDADADAVFAALEQAAGEADASGTALIVLPPTRAAATALARWNAEQGGGRLAPLSAVVERQAGG